MLRVLILIVFCFVLGCGSSDQPEINDVSQDSPTQADSTLTEETGPAFWSQFPVLTEAVANASVRPILEQYAIRATDETQIGTELDLLNLYVERDSVLIPALEPLLEKWAFKDDTAWEALLDLDQELSRLGILMLTAEGMFVGLGAGPLHTNKLAEIGSQQFRWFVAFNEAYAASLPGEYPFLDLDPERRMILLAEKLRDRFPRHEYTRKIEKRFKAALRIYTDLHTYTSDGYSAAMAMDMTREAYPFEAGLESHKVFLEENRDSKYYPVIKNLMENMSSLSGREGGPVHLAVVGWESNETSARERVFAFLESGKDVPHAIRIRRSDGSEAYAITYRFHSEERLASGAVKVAQTRANLKADLISVRDMDGTWVEM